MIENHSEDDQDNLSCNSEHTITCHAIHAENAYRVLVTKRGCLAQKSPQQGLSSCRVLVESLLRSCRILSVPSRNARSLSLDIALFENRVSSRRFHHENCIETINLIRRIFLFENPPFCRSNSKVYRRLGFLSPSPARLAEVYRRLGFLS